MRTEVVKAGHPSLRVVCDEVMHGHDCREFIEHMRVVMRRCGGVGLAANQLACHCRIIVVHCGPFRQAIINPVITFRGRGKSTAREGCLSFPGVTSGPIARDKQITVEGFDENWKPIKFKLKKLAARCVQHEVDHLNGVSIV